MKKTTSESRREKIGTILDRKVADVLRERSEQEGRTMSELIQEAVLTYRTEDEATREQRLAAVKRFCTPFDEQKRKSLKKIMDLDYYEQ
jgi:hypothetical protein